MIAVIGIYLSLYFNQRLIIRKTLRNDNKKKKDLAFYYRLVFLLCLSLSLAKG
jgi:hypothetical protein